MSINATTYQWSFPGANPSNSTDENPTVICYNTPGTYDVTLIATNGNLSDTLTFSNYITVYPYPPPQGITQNGDTLTANQGAISYQWYFNGMIIPGATNYLYVATQSGDFNVVATDQNGCEVEAVIFDVVATIPSAATDVLFSLAPNPAGSELMISYREVQPESIRVFDMVGKQVLLQSMPSVVTGGRQIQHIAIDVSRISGGLYWIEVNSGQGFFRQKFVKE